MAYDIKSFKPRKGVILQGYYKPINEGKYVGDVSKIIYRSSWELKFLKFCDENPDIIRYSSEPVSIKYYDPISKKTRKYFIDFYIEVQKEGGSVRKWLIEVKPKKFILRPRKPKKESLKSLQNYKKNVERYIRNQSKFDAAKNYAKERKMKFGLVTEDFVFKSY